MKNIESVSDADLLYSKLLRIIYRLGFDVCLLFRGQQKYDWSIKSNLAIKFNGNQSEIIERQKEAISRFEYRTKDFIRTPISNSIFSKEWDLLCQAQHNGIKTTLLDVTTEIKIALFFATEKSDHSEIEDSDGALWCIKMPNNKIRKYSELFEVNPYCMDNNCAVFNPCLVDGINNRPFENRIAKQKGGFIIVRNSDIFRSLEDIEEFQELIFKIRIPRNCKGIIRNELKSMGICKDTLYVEDSEQYRDISYKINKEMYNIVNI